MGRNWQVFAAPGEDSEEFPVEPSPWVQDRWVYIPLEHWDVLMNRAAQKNDSIARNIMLHSGVINPDVDDAVTLSKGELLQLSGFLEELAQDVETGPDLTTQVTDEMPEPYSRSEHAGMIRAVSAVFRESVRLDEPARAWKE